MNIFQKRLILFILCILTRLAITYIIYQYPYYNVIGIFMLMIGMSFVFIFIRGRDVGLETFGQPIWWNSLRPVHAVLWLLSGTMYMLQLKNYSVYLLLLDVMIGVISFALYHSGLAFVSLSEI